MKLIGGDVHMTVAGPRGTTPKQRQQGEKTDAEAAAFVRAGLQTDEEEPDSPHVVAASKGEHCLNIHNSFVLGRGLLCHLLASHSRKMYVHTRQSGWKHNLTRQGCRVMRNEDV